jgi:hypothetical protein
MQLILSSRSMKWRRQPRLIMTDDAPAAFQPFDVDPVGNIPRDPHDKNQEYTDREWEA